jgi:starch synthase (maltosyl-transferring)
MKDQSRWAARLYYVHPLLMGRIDDWGAGLDHAAGMGFDTLLSAPPFDPGPLCNLFLTHDATLLNPALGWAGTAVEGLHKLAEIATSRGLRLMLDLVIDRAAANGPYADGAAADLDRIALDPRCDPAERGAVQRDLSPERLARDIERIGALAEAGVAGFRCLGVDRLPPRLWRDLITGVRAVSPEVRFLAWTPGVAFERRHSLAEAGFDAVFSSLAWWDCRAPWIADEHDAHRRVGPVIAFPEEPFGRRLACDHAGDEHVERAAERALLLAASVGDGLMVPMGFEFGATDRMEPTRGAPAEFERLRAHARFDLTGRIAEANQLVVRSAGVYEGGELRNLTGGSAPVRALLRADTSDARTAGRARVILVNPDLRRSAAIDASSLLPTTGGRFTRFLDIAGTESLSSLSTLMLDPGEVRVLEADALQPIEGIGVQTSVEEAVKLPRFAVEAVEPAVDGGRFPVKRTVGEPVIVEADVIGDGHDKLAASLLWRAADEDEWHEVRMEPLGNDRWSAAMPLERIGRYVYTVETWKDFFATFRDELVKKHAAGLQLTLELEEGRRLVEQTFEGRPDDRRTAERLRAILASLEPVDDAARLEILLSERTAAVMRDADLRRFRCRLDPPIPVDAERGGASYASWYELFPRSMSGDPHRHGTFDDVIGELPRIRAMGFDVLYFPPIHPIGTSNRKGRNNSLKAGPDDPGSPYAIGSKDGGHDAIHPDLGTLEDFRRLVAAAAEEGLEIALDFAIQCSPDHPWLKEHPEWFDWRPDGSIRYAENPPKKYEDIVNVDFYTPGSIPSLWLALRDVVQFWVEEGVRLFRVDNPHTKSFPFWEWLIADVRGAHPDVVFLAEAFTRPKVMYRLAKIGFSQSYTYFTWRNTKGELQSYLEELNKTAAKDFFRPHFFVNTPDINPVFLQNAPRSAYLIRAGLATTLSGLWGMYNGFEVCEGRPVPGKEEYLDSEKYEIRAWDWNTPGNIVAEVTRLNRIRRDNPALHSHLGISFLPAWNDKIVWYRKTTASRDNVLLIAVSLDPHAVQEADIELPLWEWGMPDHGHLELTDLMSEQRFVLAGKFQRIRLDPAVLPFAIWRVDAAREF